MFLVLSSIAGSVKPQSATEPHFRIITYLPHTINGFAPEGSVIKLYYADSASFTPNTTQPFKTIVTGPAPYFVWVYSRATDGLGDFDGPVVVSMTKPGGEEIFETGELGADEVFILNPRPCAETQTLTMRPTVNDLFTWRDELGNPMGNDKFLRDAPAGAYTLEYKNIAGRFYRSNPVIVDAPPKTFSDEVTMQCGESSANYEGRYSGRAGSFLWIDQADGREVDNRGIVRLPPGKYDFYTISPQGCRSAPATVTVKSSPPLAVINIGGKTVGNADCNQSNGSITGIEVFGANNQTPKYRWKDTRGNLYYSLDLHGLKPDVYTLEAYTDASPCPTYLTDVEVFEKNAIELDPAYEPIRTSCGLNNGGITGLTVRNATIFKWYKGTDTTTVVSNTLELTGAAPEWYTLVLENEFGCRKEKDFHVIEGSPAIKLISPPVIKDDNCGLSKGSIIGARFNTPVTYTWLNEADQVVGRSNDLLDARAGIYRLVVKSDKCDYPPLQFTIGNTETAISAPTIGDILVCAASDVNISFKESASIYRIYDENGNLRSQSGAKDFRLRIDQPGTFYAALASGTCESPRTRFSIAFGSSGLQIPNAFSPNGDGVNDDWIIKGIDVYTVPEVKLFNRQGEVVFHTWGRSQPFNGKLRGTELPVGVYYYIVRASPECPAESGSLTLIR